MTDQTSDSPSEPPGARVILVRQIRRNRAVFLLSSAGTAVTAAGTAISIHTDLPVFATTIGLILTPWFMLVNRDALRILSMTERTLSELNKWTTRD
jgi:hypothetical protein